MQLDIKEFCFSSRELEVMQANLDTDDITELFMDAWTEQKPESFNSDDSASSVDQGRVGYGRVCCYHLQGRCVFSVGCKVAHSSLATGPGQFGKDCREGLWQAWQGLLSAARPKEKPRGDPHAVALQRPLPVWGKTRH